DAEILFFQAEDGIRDLIVTGVQTCALPIWLTLSIEESHLHVRPLDVMQQMARQMAVDDDVLILKLLPIDVGVARQVPRLAKGDRSEERRVGKECRERWATETKTAHESGLSR